jgi:hypothetical protein
MELTQPGRTVAGLGSSYPPALVALNADEPLRVPTEEKALGVAARVTRWSISLITNGSHLTQVGLTILMVLLYEVADVAMQTFRRESYSIRSCRTPLNVGCRSNLRGLAAKFRVYSTRGCTHCIFGKSRGASTGCVLVLRRPNIAKCGAYRLG